MSDVHSSKLPVSLRVLITAACFVVVVAGMRAANTIIIPFLLAIFIAIICTPLMFWLLNPKIPNILAVITIIIIIIALGTLIAVFVGKSANVFIDTMPKYEARLTTETSNMITLVQAHGVDISDDIVKDFFNPGRAMKMAATTLNSFTAMLTNTFMILLTVVFIMLEAAGFPRKLAAALEDPDKSLASFNKFAASVNRYLAIKTLFSFVTGVFLYIWLRIQGLDFPLLWALLAFLLNFVPNIGSIIAAIPAILLSLVQLGVGPAVVTGLGFLIVNICIGSILEPRFLGEGLGLSTLVVFLSLVFWGWVLGPVGMLLSVPLTMILKIALESSDDTRWLGVLLGSDRSLSRNLAK